MVYQYKCVSCLKTFDVYKSVKDIERNENCPSCGEFGVREFVPARIYLNKTQVTHAEYNPALGQVVKNEHHKKEILKQKGLVEIGNDYGSSEKLQKKFDVEREEKREKSYEEADSGWVGDGSQ